MDDMARREDIDRAAAFALSGEWDKAHEIAQQDESDPLSCWLHACLHKIEGDAGNSRYWYRRAGRAYEDFADSTDELRAIRTACR